MSDISHKANINDIQQTSIKCPHFYKSPEEKVKDDMVRTCSIAISTVMLMANGSYKDITREHVKYIEMYSRDLINKGKNLYNITRILEILKNLHKSGIVENAQEGMNMAGSEEYMAIDDLIN